MNTPKHPKHCREGQHQTTNSPLKGGACLSGPPSSPRGMIGHSIGQLVRSSCSVLPVYALVRPSCSVLLRGYGL